LFVSAIARKKRGLDSLTLAHVGGVISANEFFSTLLCIARYRDTVYGLRQ
jgi:hypothetical protein